jgi:amino acid adenylation domain-containing protein
VSYEQEGLWFEERLGGSGADYNVPVVYRLRGRLDARALRGSLDAVVARHEVLRTTVREVDGVAVQQVHGRGGMGWRTADLRGATPAQVARRVRAEVRRRFDLTRGPVSRACLLRVGTAEHVLVVTLHHLVCDGWSLSVLTREVEAHYAAARRGTLAVLPPLSLQYADYAVWQRSAVRTARLAAGQAYWGRQLAGLTAGPLPTDRPRPAAARRRAGGAVAWGLDAEVTAALRQLGQREHATLFMVLMAGLQAWLARVTGTPDVVVGTPVAGRTAEELTPLIGCFVNLVPLRGTVDSTASFRALVRATRARLLEAWAHQDYPFELLVAQVAPPRATGRAALLDIVCTWQNQPLAALTLEGLTVTSEGVEAGTIRYDLEVVLRETADGGVQGMLRYATDILTAATVTQWGAAYAQLLTTVSAAAETPVGRVSLLPAAARTAVVTQWAVGPRVAVAPGGVAARVQAVAHRQPDAAAVVAGAATLTYGVLEAQANQLAHVLRSAGVGPERRVGVVLPRGPALVVTLLGVLKAGGVYVPVDPSAPAARRRALLADAQATVVVTSTADQADTGAWQMLPLDAAATAGSLATAPVTPLPSALHPGQLAYIIYTSGSTGTPKGVMVSHDALANLVDAQTHAFGVKRGSRVLQFLSPAFDASLSELLVTLCAGGTLHVLPNGDAVVGRDLVNVLNAATATHVTLTRSVAMSLPPEALIPSLAALIVGGEECPRELVQRWATRTRLINAYGPTENSVCAALHLCRPTDRSERVPIGKPIQNVRTYVLDTWMEAVAAGAAGDLYLGGGGVARGYADRPRMTADRFVPDPFEPGQRLFRTGDRARWNSRGQLEFLGRSDDQVKVGGFRIEPREIEAALLEHPDVNEVAVVPHGENTDRRLVAYVVCSGDQSIASSTLRSHLSHRLPSWMIPAVFVQLSALPLTPNGKLDAKQLIHLLVSPPPGHVPPRTPLEELLCTIWRDVLDVERVGIHDGFFDVGGHSLKVLAVRAAIADRIGHPIDVADLFDYPTVAELSAHLSATGITLPAGTCL